MQIKVAYGSATTYHTVTFRPAALIAQCFNIDDREMLRCAIDALGFYLDITARSPDFFFGHGDSGTRRVLLLLLPNYC